MRGAEYMHCVESHSASIFCVELVTQQGSEKRNPQMCHGEGRTGETYVRDMICIAYTEALACSLRKKRKPSYDSQHRALDGIKVKTRGVSPRAKPLMPSRA